MENYPPTNNPNISQTLQYSQNNNQDYISPTLIPRLQNSQIPAFDHAINNFNDQNHPLQMNPTLPNSFPSFPPLENQGQLAQNTGNMSPPLLNPTNVVFYFGSTDSDQEQGSHNNSSNLKSMGANISQTSLNPGNPVSNIGINLSSEGEGSNKARETRGGGRPLGSKNKVKVNNPATEELFIEPVVLQIPSGKNVIDYLVEYAESRKISLTVLGGFGSISKVGFKYSDSQPLVFIEENMTIMSISGTYLYSATGRSPSQSFFNVMVAGQNSKIYNGKAYQIITAGPTTLTVIC